MPDIIFDTNVLSNFSLAGRFDLLKLLYNDSACCAGAVATEIQRGIQCGHAGLSAVANSLAHDWPRIEDPASTMEHQLFAALSISLGAGESACIVLAAQRGYVFACDDRLARTEAMRLGVKLTGTVGILIKTVRVEAIDVKGANTILRKMVKAGFYAPVKSITALMVCG
jgi:predicted nucleic acid-binding protein